MKNLLVPTDFSAAAHHAYVAALHLARGIGGRVTLLHVLEAPKARKAKSDDDPAEDDGAGPLPLPNPQRLEDARHRLQALQNEAAQLAAGVPVAEVVEVGRVGKGILRAIQHHGIDLVVVGAQGHGALTHFLVGSNTEHLIRLASCPVLTIKNPPANAFAVRTILFPSDFSEELPIGSGGLRQVQAAFPEAALHLLHVRKSRRGSPALPRIRAFAERAGLHNVHMEVVRAGSAAAGIAQYAQRVGADLVVIPTHARTGISALLQNSIAETVATHALPPVLTYHLVRLSR